MAGWAIWTGLVRGPVPMVRESFRLTESGGHTVLDYDVRKTTVDAQITIRDNAFIIVVRDFQDPYTLHVKQLRRSLRTDG